MIDPKDKDGNVVVKQIWQPKAWMFYAAAVAACVLGVWAISASLATGRANEALAAVKADAQKTLTAAQAQAAQDLGAARQAGLRRTAQAVARVLEPFVAIKGQVPEISDRTLQSAVRNLVKDRDLRFVAVTDASGKVVAASDLTLVGRPLASPSSMAVESAPIGDDPGRGSVAIGMAR